MSQDPDTEPTPGGAAAALAVGDKITKPVRGVVTKLISGGQVAVVRDTQQKTRFISVERIVKR